MTSTAFLRFAGVALIAIAAATTATAQYVTVPPGMNPTVSPNPVGTPGGPSATIPTGSTIDSSNLQGDLSRATAGRSGASRRDAARPAKAGELTVGAAIADNKGAEVGYIKAVDPDGVVVATTGGQIKVPAEALGKNKNGLLIGMSKADFDKLVAHALGG